ncbi:MAG: tetratricopeptide repeat protein [Acidobacteriaceae bacterium]
MNHAQKAALAATFLLLTSLAARAQDFSQTQTAPAPTTPLIQQANDALAANDLPTALRLLTALNAQTPNNPQVLYDLGLTLEAMGPELLANTPPATAAPTPTPPTNTGERTPPDTSPPTQPATPELYYRAAIAADPTFPPPHAALGLLLARTGHPAQAHAELLTAANLSTIEPALKARTLRALARLDLEGYAPDPQTQASPQTKTPPNPALAATELLAALQLTPETPSDILLSAQIAEAESEASSDQTATDAAEKAYRRYLALRPQDPTATSALAHILLTTRRPAEAETLLTAALAANPNPNPNQQDPAPAQNPDPALTAQLARAYLADADPTKQSLATPLLEKLHATHPEDPNVARLLARVYLETGHPEQAEPLYAALIAAQTANYISTASQSGTTQANTATAAPKPTPQPIPDPTLLAARAEALIRLHRPGEAETLLKQAVANPSAFPTSEDFADAATTLAFAAAQIDDPRETLQALALRATVLPPSAATLFLEATANDTLHQTRQAVDLYTRFLAEAAGSLPDQESQARTRLAALTHRK